MKSYSQEIKKVGAAVTSSPRLNAVLGEAWRFAQRLDAPLTLLHAGERDGEKTKQFREACDQLGIPPDTGIVWREGNPAEAIVTAAENQEIELLVAGALEGGDICDRSFLGAFARPVAHQARLSLLLLTRPQADPSRFQKIVVITDFSECAKTALNNALWLARNDEAEFVYVISIFTPFMKARAEAGTKTGNVARTRDDEERMMEEFLACMPADDVKVESKIVDATTGFAACDFANSIGADLLIMPAHDEAGTGLPPMADWALHVIPCSLWIVRINARANPSNHARN